MLTDTFLLGLHGGAFAAPLAYIGPGADLGLIGSVIGLVLTLGTSSLFMLLWPVRSLFRRFRNPAEAANEDSVANP